MEETLAAPPKLTDFMKQALDKVAIDEGFKNYTLNLIPGASVGDGFVGIILRATIEEIDEDRKLELIVKVPPESQSRRQEFKSMIMFEREVFAYNKVLPKFAEFQLENNIGPDDGFFNFPKVFYAEFNKGKDDSIIVMEDLKVSGYQTFDKLKPVDFEHAKLLMASLGRFHAISYAFKKREDSCFEEFKTLHDHVVDECLDPKYISYMKSLFDKALEDFGDDEQEDKAKLMQFKDNYVDFLTFMKNPENLGDFNVIVHGDCWTNNFMFQYKDEHPESIRFIDWQLCHYGTPAQDIVYFLFACTDKTTRSQHYEELLRIYRSSLHNLLKKFDGIAVEQFPESALSDQLQKFGKYGILMSFFLVPLMTSKNEDLPDMELVADSMAVNPDAGLDLMMKNQSADSRIRIKENIVDACKYGYL